MRIPRLRWGHSTSATTRRGPSHPRTSGASASYSSSSRRHPPRWTRARRIVSVPTSVPSRLADAAFLGWLASVAVVGLATLLVVTLALTFLVTRRVRRVTAAAGEVSEGKLNLDDLPLRGKDEIFRVGRRVQSHATKPSQNAARSLARRCAKGRRINGRTLGSGRVRGGSRADCRYLVALVSFSSPAHQADHDLNHAIGVPWERHCGARRRRSCRRSGSNRQTRRPSSSDAAGRRAVAGVRASSEKRNVFQPCFATRRLPCLRDVVRNAARSVLDERDLQTALVPADCLGRREV